MVMSDCAARYSAYEKDRTIYLNRARQCSKLTLPTLVPPVSNTSSTTYVEPWQSVGSRGVNNLASRLLLALFPPNSPYFKLSVDDFTLAEIAGNTSARAKVDEGLNKIERAVSNEMEGDGLRNTLFLSLKYLIVAGNALLYVPKTGRCRVWRLDHYVVKRDASGNLIEIIAKDTVDPASLSDDELALIKDGNDSENDNDGDEGRGASQPTDHGESVDIYTRFYRDGTQWHLYQEINNQVVPGSKGVYPEDAPAMIALRWTSIDNEDYGRSYVEEYLGDLISLEGLSEAIVGVAAIAAKAIILVKPGTTKVATLASAKNGAIVSGNIDDVGFLQANKQSDMNITYQAAKTITERLYQAFLMNSAVRRDAERVTAEEVRYIAGELEDALGGVYSIMSQELQLPLVTRIMARMTAAKRLPKLPKGVVKPQIVTGLEALGRGHDLQKLQTLFSIIQPLGPKALAYLNVGDAIKRVGTSLGMDMGGLIKTDEEIAQQQQDEQAQQQQAMMADIAGKATPNAVKGLSDHLNAQAQPPAQ